MNSANSQGPTDAFSSGAVLCGHSTAITPRQLPAVSVPPPPLLPHPAALPPPPRTEVLATLPRCVIFLLCFSLAIRMRCLATMMRPGRSGPPAAANRSLPASARRGAARRKYVRRCGAGPGLPAANPRALPASRVGAPPPHALERRGRLCGGRDAAHPEAEVELAAPRWRPPRRCWQVRRARAAGTGPVGAGGGRPVGIGWPCVLCHFSLRGGRRAVAGPGPGTPGPGPRSAPRGSVPQGLAGPCCWQRARAGPRPGFPGVPASCPRPFLARAATGPSAPRPVPYTTTRPPPGSAGRRDSLCVPARCCRSWARW